MIVAITLVLFLVAAIFVYSFDYSGITQSLPQSSYSLFENIKLPTSSDRIMIVSPHPDDEMIGAAGYLLKAHTAGATLEIVSATDGNKHGLKDERALERDRAVSLTGYADNVIQSLNFPDGDLSKQKDFEPTLEKLINDFKPTVVITTLPEDTHTDHAASGKAVNDIIQRQPNKFIAYYFLVHYHSYPRPIGYEPDLYLLPSPKLISSQYQWLTLPLNNNEITLKKKIIEQYQSQLSLKNPILRDLIYSFVRQNELFAVKR